MLVGLIYAAVGGVAVLPAAADGGRLSAEEAFRRAAAGEITLIDVRSPQEWRETGIPQGGRPVTLHNPKGLDAFLEEVLEAVDGDRARPVALICASGGRSSRARASLAARGFTQVYDVSEGMLGRADAPGWLRRGLPVTPCRNC